MKVTFWGVRGSIATSGPATARYGGNTTCVQISHAGHHLILDAGTGSHALGNQLMDEARTMGGGVQASFLFSHLHWDHIQGFPLFGPAFMPSTELNLYGPTETDESGHELDLQAALSRQMTRPFFPVPLSAMASTRRYERLYDGAEFEIGPFAVSSRALCHPQGSLGFRVEAGGRSVCFATDTEQVMGQDIDPALLHLARDADLLIHDAQYTDAEYEGSVGPPRQGWGHSTYAAAAAAATAAGAKQLALFHHDPSHDDSMMDALEADARTLHPACRAAREGLSVEL